MSTNKFITLQNGESRTIVLNPQPPVIGSPLWTRLTATGSASLAVSGDGLSAVVTADASITGLEGFAVIGNIGTEFSGFILSVNVIPASNPSLNPEITG